MSQLTSTETFSDGDYQVTVIIGTGTAAILLSNKDVTERQIPGASWSASTIELLTVADCSLTPVLTGDAQIFISPKRSV